MIQSRDLGIAVVGSGRIGTLRATLAAAYPAVRFLAIFDRDPERARKLAERTGAPFHSGDNLEAISRTGSHGNARMAGLSGNGSPVQSRDSGRRAPHAGSYAGHRTIAERRSGRAAAAAVADRRDLPQNSVAV
jgi:threonine dehydrogenase-like Zn-dependent dehydrogenase